MIKLKPLLISLAATLGAGGLAALLTRDSMQEYAALNQPPLAPPGWLFPVVWTILYVLMAVAAYLVFVYGSSGRSGALLLYGIQLVFNVLWTVFFFNLHWYLFSFLWLAALWLLILLTTLRFWRERKSAGLLMLPYLAWVAFAGYLNLSIWLLNG